MEEEARALSHLGQVYIYQEDWEEALACLNRSQDTFILAGSDEYLPELERRWGEFYLGTDGLDQALVHALRSVELAVEQGHPLEEGLSCRMLGRVHMARGEDEPAEAALRQSLQILGDLDSKYEVAKTKLSLVRLAVETGIFPLYEVEDGIHYTINYSPKGYLVNEYFKLQGRFKHLTDEDLEEIQEMVDEDWKLLLRKAGISI